MNFVSFEAQWSPLIGQNHFQLLLKAAPDR